MSESLFELLAPYRAVLLDAYGVLRDSRGLYAGTPEFLRGLRARGQPYVVVTNDASKDLAGYLASYEGLVTAERFLSASMVAAHTLGQDPTVQRVTVIGTDASGEVFRREGLEVESFDGRRALDPAAIDAIVLTDEGSFDWRGAITETVNAVRARPAIQVLCPNGDLLYPSGPGTVGIGPGVLGQALGLALGRAVPTSGKPAPALFARALALLREDLPDLEPGQVCMVGDTPETDMVGGATAGHATCLVLSGNTQPERARELCAKAGVEPTHVSTGIA